MGSSFQYIEGGEDWHAEPANRLASSEKQDKKPKGEKEMSEEAIAAEEKQKSVPLRDEKGHFIGKCKHDKKNAEKNEDPNVVKIKIVKEKKPKMYRILKIMK